MDSFTNGSLKLGQRRETLNALIATSRARLARADPGTHGELGCWLLLRLRLEQLEHVRSALREQGGDDMPARRPLSSQPTEYELVREGEWLEFQVRHCQARRSNGLAPEVAADVERLERGYRDRWKAVGRMLLAHFPHSRFLTWWHSPGVPPAEQPP